MVEFLNEILFFIDGVFFNSLGLIFVVIGAYISIRILDFPDLTIDGVFTLGGVIFAKLLIIGINPWFALLLSGFIGFLPAFIVFVLNSRFGIGKILSTVLVLIIITSLNAIVLGQATIGMLDKKTIFYHTDKIDTFFNSNYFNDQSFSLHPTSIFLILIIAAIILYIFSKYLKTKDGTILRCIGERPKSSTLISKNLNKYKLIGLLTASFFVSLGGAIESQRKGATDLSMGNGMLVIAICSIVLGDTIIRYLIKKQYLSPNQIIYSIITGVFIFCLIKQIVLTLGFSTIDINLFTGVFLALLLIITSKKVFRSSEYF